MHTITVTVPESLKDIKLNIAQKILQDVDEDEEINERKILSIGYDLKPTTIVKMPIKQRRELVNKFKIAVNKPCELVQRFTHNGTEYGFVPNIDKISFAEFVDLDKLGSDVSNAHKIASILYRPIKSKSGKFYRIKAYNADEIEERAKMLEDMNADIGIGCLLFFWNLSHDLLKAIPKSLQEKIAEIS